MIKKDFPPSWAVCQVSEAGVAISGQQKTPAASHASEQYPYLRVANVFDDECDFSDLATMYFPVEARERLRLREGDVLLCEGQSRELVGRCALYRGEVEELYFQNSIIRFRPHKEILPEYALLVFRAYQKEGVFSQIAKSTTNIAHLGLNRFKSLPFPVPPRTVQESLADTARAFQERVDTARHVLNESIPEIESLARKVRDQVMIGDSVPEAHAVSAGTAFPWKTAAESVAVDAPIVYGILQPGPDIDDGTGIPYVQQQDLQNGEIVEGKLRNTSLEVHDKFSRSAIASGDVLLGIIRNTRVAVVPPELDGGNINRGIARLRPREDLESEYLAHWLSSEWVQRWLSERMRGIDMPGLNLRDVRLLPVPVPKLAEQRKKVHLINQVVNKVRETRATLVESQRELVETEVRTLPALAYGHLAREVSQGLGFTENSMEAVGLVKRLRERQVPLKRTVKRRAPSKRNPKEMSPQSGELNADNLLQVLQESGGRISPEDLYRSMSLEDSAVDDFYALLRDMRREGRIGIDRPDEEFVFVTAGGEL
ncbi:restriction endonuclease subunit S [Streptomyces caniscabiei]|uniref:restriction endonuclease subunit S n=1 Tax=Streptomyces caniscabiei TaxID=2746961 RepID=UPI0009A0BC39|nr:restriction endonuclease subunit S [Streptomyces caniscabiei]